MTFKALNDSTDFNNLDVILLMFYIYFCMIEMNISFSTITQRLIDMQKAIKENDKIIAFSQMNDFQNIQNDSSTILIHDLSLNSFVLIYREKNAD